MNLNLEDERSRYREWCELDNNGYRLGGALETQRRLVSALEQLEQAREAHRKMTAHATSRQLAHLDNHNGDVYHEMQALTARFGFKALKQQEVADDH